MTGLSQERRRTVLGQGIQERRCVELIFGKSHIVQFPTQCLPIFFREAPHADLDIFAGGIEHFVPIILTQGFSRDDFFQFAPLIENAYWVKHRGSLLIYPDAG